MTTGTRCKAQAFDGTEPRQCTRPASAERDGIPVCRQHARVAMQPYTGLVSSVPFDAAARTVGTILDEFETAYRFVVYDTARRAVLVAKQAQQDEILIEYRRNARTLAIGAGLALLDAGLDDETILAELHTVMVAA
jgi:hypothetical protein